jgi:hypothetical protein
MAETVSIYFEPVGLLRWRSQARCSHGVAETMTEGAVPGVPSHVAFVQNIWRHHQLVVGCNCTQQPPTLNATVAFQQSLGVQPGELRIIREQSATIPPPANNFLFYGRLVCMRTGACYVDATLRLAKSVASGARGVGQVFAAGNPPMLNLPLSDVAGRATAAMTGLVNLFPNQPFAVAYLNTGSTSQDVQSTTLRISEVWVPIEPSARGGNER